MYILFRSTLIFDAHTKLSFQKFVADVDCQIVIFVRNASNVCVSRSAASILSKSVREQKRTHTQYIIAPAEINATMLRTNGMHSECYKYGGINNIVIYSYRGCVFFLCISHSWRPKRKAGELTHVLIGSN